MKSASISQSQLIESTFSLSSAPINALLLLRIVTDTQDNQSALEQDIQNLHAYPDRLYLRYPDEWRARIKLTLLSNAFNAQDLSDALSLQRYLEKQFLHRETEINNRFRRYRQIIEHVSKIEQAENVYPLKSKNTEPLQHIV